MTAYEMMIPAAMQIARQLGGRAKVRGSSTLHVVGLHQNLAVRVRMTEAGHEVDYAVDIRMPEARKPFVLRRVGESEETFTEFRKHWDDWDTEDSGDGDEQRIYVGDRIAHVGTGEEVEGSHHVWQSLSEEHRSHVIELIAGGGGGLWWRGNRLTLDPADDAGLMELKVASMKLLDFGVWLAHGLKQLQTSYR